MTKFETYFAQQIRDISDDDFKSDLANLLKLTPNARAELAKGVVKSLLLTTEREKRGLLDELVGKFKQEPVPLPGPFQILLFFAKSFVADPDDDPISKDEPKKIASDITKMEHVYPKDVPNAEAIFGEILGVLKETAAAVKNDVRRRTYESGILPSFKGIGTTVELRAIQESEFGLGEDIEKYVPKISGLVGVASIRIRVAGGDPEIFCFQASDRELSYLIDALRAAQKELKLLESTVKNNDARKA